MTSPQSEAVSAQAGKKHLPYFDSLAQARAGYRRRFQYYYDDIARYCGYFIHEESSVLEVGCGTGELLAEVPGRRKVGIDFSSLMVAEARRQFPALEFHVMDAEQIELNEAFDVILVSNLVGYLEDVQKMLEGLRRVCHDRTKIILTNFNHAWEPLLHLAEKLGIKARAPEQNWLSQKDLENLLYLAGLETYQATPRMLLPLRIPLISWFLNRFVGSLPGFRQINTEKHLFIYIHSANVSGHRRRLVADSLKRLVQLLHSAWSRRLSLENWCFGSENGLFFGFEGYFEVFWAILRCTTGTFSRFLL